jgi:hypothetical protein
MKKNVVKAIITVVITMLLGIVYSYFTHKLRQKG